MEFKIAQLLTKNPEVIEHSLRVFLIANSVLPDIPQEYVSERQKSKILTAALLHDLGKGLWQDDWFLKPRYKILPEEWEIMKLHAVQTVEILRSIGFHDNEVLEIIEKHHEKPGGQGYPKGIEPDNDSLVLVACDVYSACTEFRPYRGKIMSHEEAMQEISKFCPAWLVRAFQRIEKFNQKR